MSTTPDRSAPVLGTAETPPRCTCGPDHTGEAPDFRPDCPVHGYACGSKYGHCWEQDPPAQGCSLALGRGVHRGGCCLCRKEPDDLDRMLHENLLDGGFRTAWKQRQEAQRA